MSGHSAVQPTVYRAGLAMRPDAVEAVVFDLPGCVCTASDEASVRALLPVVIAEHIAWLDQHGDVTRDAFPFEVDIAEKVDAVSMTDIAEGEFCFDDDLQQVTRDEVENAIRRMSYARQDLLRVVSHLPEMVLDWQPPERAVRTDDWAPEVRSIRRILGHVAGSDNYYAGNVGDARWHGVRPGDTPDLFEQRHMVIERLRALTEGDLAAKWERRQLWQTEGHEHWTVRKALRRIISHERFHTKEIEQRLAWLLLGAPELAPKATKVTL